MMKQKVNSKIGWRQFHLDSSDIEVKEYDINKKITASEKTIEVLNAKEYLTGMFVQFKYQLEKLSLFENYWIWDSNKGDLDAKSYNPNIDDSTLTVQHNPPSEDGEVFLIPYQYGLNDAMKKILISLEKGKYDFGNKGSIEILAVTDVEDKTEITVRTTGVYATHSLQFEGDVENQYYSPIYKKDKKILGVLDTEITYIYDKLDRSTNYYIYEVSDGYEILYDQMIKIK